MIAIRDTSLNITDGNDRLGDQTDESVVNAII